MRKGWRSVTRMLQGSRRWQRLNRPLLSFAKHNGLDVASAQAYLDHMKTLYPDSWADRTGFEHFERRPDTGRIRKPGRRGIPKEIRQLVLERDGHKCFFCKSKKKLHVHHLLHRKDGGTDDPENLLAVCGNCHARLHEGENIYPALAATVH